MVEYKFKIIDNDIQCRFIEVGLCTNPTSTWRKTNKVYWQYDNSSTNGINYYIFLKERNDEKARDIVCKYVSDNLKRVINRHYASNSIIKFEDNE